MIEFHLCKKGKQCVGHLKETTPKSPTLCPNGHATSHVSWVEKWGGLNFLVVSKEEDHLEPGDPKIGRAIAEMALEKELEQRVIQNRKK